MHTCETSKMAQALSRCCGLSHFRRAWARSACVWRASEQVRAMLFSVPGLSDVFSASSWGQTIYRAENVEFFNLESSTSTANWNTISAARAAVVAQRAYQARVRQRSFERVMIIQPGTSFGAMAFMGPGRLPSFPSYQHEMGSGIFWSTLCHELGHNLGLGHTGSFVSDGTYDQYNDDALMGYQRSTRTDHYAGPQCRTAQLLAGRICDDMRGLACGSHESVHTSRFMSIFLCVQTQRRTGGCMPMRMLTAQ